MDDRIRKLIRIVIVLIGIGILVYPSLSEFLMERNSSRAIAVYDDTVSKMQAEKINALFEEAESYNKRLAVSTGYEKPIFIIRSVQDILKVHRFLLEEQIPMPYCRDTEVCRLPIYLLTLTGWKKEMSFT